MPLFMVASAAEATPMSAAAANSWRTMMANLLAGATAGCAVEAGEQY